MIRRFTYDPGTCELCVTFVTGRCYQYGAVPPQVVDELRSASSRGRYFNARIRCRYPFKRVAECPDDPPVSAPLLVFP
ncbi:KTSC domain-containing protein [Sphingomonas sp.]|uniref:KTSC domain-containing protein n=1 Tax=Sphingomonas sp. TaxID=28214 RepID=UPI0025FD71B7|nr:KTSC domain-containing protein [Sphingomonas sp.]